MTLEELDNALEKTGLDLKNNPLDIDARNQVLALHGQSILDSKKDRCARCWFREKGKCSPSCYLYNLPKDPVEVSKKYLSIPNDINIFSFLCLYMVPVYEKITGNTNTMRKLTKRFIELINKKI